MTGNKKNWKKKQANEISYLRRESRESHLMGIAFLVGALAMGMSAADHYNQAMDIQENLAEETLAIKKDFRGACEKESATAFSPSYDIKMTSQNGTTIMSSSFDKAVNDNANKDLEQCMTGKAEEALGQKVMKHNDKTDSHASIALVLLLMSAGSFFIASRQEQRARNQNNGPQNKP